MFSHRVIASLLLPLPLALVACSGDDDAECTGHLCGEPAKITDHDGGNILFEYIYFDTELQAAFKLPAGVTTINRIIAYFTNHQTPENNPLPMPGKCNNFDATKGWPMYQGDTHEDLDVGDFTITGKNKAGADVELKPERTVAMTDSIGRRHDLFYQVLQGPADNYIKHDSFYSLKFGGKGTAPAVELPDALFLAADFTVKEPGLEDNGPLTAGTDYTVKWNPTTSANLPAGQDVLGVTWLVDPKGSPTHMCPTALADGQFKIPGTALTEYKQVVAARGFTPAEQKKVILLRNAIVHRLQPLPNGEKGNPRRIDCLTVMCWAQLMDIN
jgi:hypothetical protein